MMAKVRRKIAHDPRAKRPNESWLEWNSRMAQIDGAARDKSRPLVSPEAESHGKYETDFVLHHETGTKAETKVNRESDILEKWIRQGGIGFDKGACTAIRTCQFYWHRMGGRRITAHYGERVPSGGEGISAHEATSEIHHLKRGIPKPYWDVFENVVRHYEPAGYAGSRLAKNCAQQIIAAKTVVGFVASLIATREGY